MNYCTHCGAPLAEGAQFCTGCGTQANAMVTSQAAASPAAPPQFAPVAVSNAPPAPATSGSGCRNLAIGAVVLLVVIGALGIAGAYYAYHSVKQKATALLHGAGVVGNAVAHHDSDAHARRAASLRIGR